MKNMNDPRSDEYKYPEGDMNANPTRPFYVDTDLSHYVVREQATGKSLTKRCTFDEADHACNLLNYGWRACQKQGVAARPVRFRAEPWECGECVITADGSPVGGSISKMHAEAACEWVATAWAELIKANTNATQKAGEQ